MARGNEARAIFSDEQDREKFLSCMEATIARHGIIVHSWCLMGNHYHLLVETSQANNTRAIQYLNSGYTAYYNARHHRIGHLFQGRYKAILVEKDSYLHELSRYIHMNPVRAHIVEKPEEYDWTSYRGFIGKGKPDNILTTGTILGMFSENKSEARELYRKFVEESPKNDKKRMGKLIQGGLVLGGDTFTDWVRKTFLSDRAVDRDQPQLNLMKKRPGIAEIEQWVKPKVKDTKQQRKIAIYLSRKYTGNTLIEIADYFGGMKDSAVCQICRRLDKVRKIDKETDRLLQSLEKLSRVEG